MSDEQEIKELANLLGKECCMNNEKPEPYWL